MPDVLFSKLRSVQFRQWFSAIAKASVIGVWIGSAFAAVLACWRWSENSLTATEFGFATLLGAPLLMALVTVWRCWRNSDWSNVAQAIDGHYQLKDQTESTLSLMNRKAEPSDPWIVLQFEQTVRHLQRVEAKDVVPQLMPKSWRWAALTSSLTAAFLSWPTGHTAIHAEPTGPIAAIVAEAEHVEADLLELLEQLPEEHDPEVDKVIQDLLDKAKEMQQPGVDLREALAQLSEMQAALQEVAAELNVGAIEEQLKSIGESLQSSESLKSAGEALQAGDHNKAADELAKLDNPQLDRKEARTVSDKLKKNSEQAANKGQKKLSDAAKQVAEGLEKDNPQQAKDGLNKLGDAAKQQANRKKVSDLLKKQTDRLGESKGNCQANASQGARPSQQAGQGSNSETQGQRTELAAKHKEERIEGQKGQQGDAETEKETTTTSTDEQSQRTTKEVYQKYRKLSDAVLEGEDIPLGHRQTIRRYFEAIRPAGDEANSDAGKR